MIHKKLKYNMSGYLELLETYCGAFDCIFCDLAQIFIGHSYSLN